GGQLKNVICKTFDTIESNADIRQMTNAQLRQIIRKIEVDRNGNVDIFIWPFESLRRDKNILIHNDRT
ncbi:MAG: recombinase family protein, partial [Oscillospiraceae bacterium]